MHFGLFSLMSKRDPDKPVRALYQEMVEQVMLAESMGFEIAWLAEHHFTNYCVCPSPLTLASHLAARTSRIKLGPAVLVLPLYEPIRLLEDIATVDLLSGGRLVLGLGSGYQKYEFQRFGIALEEGRDRFVEGLGLIERFYEGEPVSYQGRYLQVPETYFTVRPLNPHPQIYVAGLLRDEQTQRHIARRGYVPFVTTGWNPLSSIQASRQICADARIAAGLGTDDMPFAMQKYVYVSDDPKEVLNAAEQARYVRRVAFAMRFQYARTQGAFLEELPAEDEPPLEEIASNLWMGPPEVVAEKIVNDCQVLRPSHVSCFMALGNVPQDKTLRSMQRFGDQVMPLVDKHLSGARRSAPAAAAAPR